MEQLIYRYTSFETFVGMIQSQKLTFVLPEVWEDPYELKGFTDLLKKTENAYDRMIFTLLFHKTFCQSWTEADESDAMWRIYSYGCRALRVSVKKESVSLLDNVKIVPINYGTSPIIMEEKSKQEMFINALSQKRNAFKHEEEIRLISTQKFRDDDDLERQIKGLLVIQEHPKAVELIESLFPSMETQAQVKELCHMLNMGKYKNQTKDISFNHIPDFINGVMVHPQAPDWYAKIVEDYCQINNIHYEGKSKLYSEIDY